MVNINFQQECYKTGGGTYDSKCSEIDLKIINILKDNFTPDDNPFDSSADLFVEGLYITTYIVKQIIS